MTPAVVDASVVAKWFLDDQPLAAEAFAARAAHALMAPALLLTELANALWKYTRLSRLELGVAMDSIDLTAREVSLVEDRLLLRAAQRLSTDFDHPVYDCLYVSLAQREGVPLVTADAKLSRKFGELRGLQLIELPAYGEPER